MSRPLVSVVVTSYNYAHFLRPCIDSVLAQTYRPVEVIVVDDGSIDDTRDVLEGYGDCIRAIFQENAGQAAAMSRGVAESTGDILCLLDCDDTWEPQKVERVAAVLEAHPGVDWVRHKSGMVDEALRPLGAVAPMFRGSGPIPPEPVLFLERVVNCPPTCLTMRRRIATRVFPLEIEPELRYDADDAVLLARIFAAGAVGYSLDEVLSSYRRHAGERFGAHDLPRLLNREADVTAALPRVFGRSEVPSPTYKLRSVLAFMDGARLWSPRRSREFVGGVRAAARLNRYPKLMGRQLLALSFAFLAPGLWLRRQARTQQWPDVHEEGTASAAGERTSPTHA